MPLYHPQELPNWPLDTAAAMLESRGHDAHNTLIAAIGRMRDGSWDHASESNLAKLLRILITGEETGGKF